MVIPVYCYVTLESYTKDAIVPKLKTQRKLCLPLPSDQEEHSRPVDQSERPDGDCSSLIPNARCP